MLEETIDNLRKEVVSNKVNLYIFYDGSKYSTKLEEKTNKALEIAMIPINDKINENGVMLKNLLTMFNAGMKATLDNLLTLSSVLEGNKEGIMTNKIDLTDSSQQMGPGTKTRSNTRKKIKAQDQEIMNLKESIKTMQSHLEDSKCLLKTLT